MPFHLRIWKKPNRYFISIPLSSNSLKQQNNETSIIFNNLRIAVHCLYVLFLIPLHHLSWHSVIIQPFKWLLPPFLICLALFGICVRHTLHWFCMQSSYGPFMMEMMIISMTCCIYRPMSIYGVTFLDCVLHFSVVCVLSLYFKLSRSHIAFFYM